MLKRKLTVHWRDYDSVKTISEDSTYIVSNPVDDISSVSSASFTMSDDDSLSETPAFITEVIAINRPSDTRWSIFFYSYLCCASLLLVLSLLLSILPILNVYGVNYELRKYDFACTHYSDSNCLRKLEQKDASTCCYLDINSTLREGEVICNDDNAQISIIVSIILFIISVCMLRPCFNVICTCCTNL